MKNTIFILLVCCLLIGILVGCSKKVETEFSEIELQNAPSVVKSFVDRNSEKNGVYLYSDNKLDDYIFFNTFNVNQGDKAAFFKNINCSIKENTLNIFFNEELTDDYSEEIKNKVIYRIKSRNKFDTIKLFRDGKEILFSAIGT